MEQWQIEALGKLLETETKQVEEARVYLSSSTYGDSRYHILDKRYDGVRVEQINIDDKWGSKVHLQYDEIPALLKTLLTWHLDGVKQDLERKQEQDELGDLDDHPF